MTTLVQARLLPEGDPKQQLQTLQQGVLQQFIWIRQHDAKGLPVDKETYKRFMGILLSSLYVFSPQGRCQGIEDLKLGQADDLIHNGFIQTTKFKTQARWGFQPVTLSEESKELMTIYLRTFRPVAAGPMPSQPTDALLLNFVGQPHYDIGKEVISFYVNCCNLHITPTRIRSIVETAAEEMFRAGEISLKTRKSVEAINGHTSATVQNYYLQMDRAADVHSARSFFSQAALEPTPIPVPIQQSLHRRLEVPDDSDDGLCALRIPDTVSASTNGETSGWATREGNKHLEWGTSHPEYQRLTVRKVKWSAQELQYIEEWIDNDVQGDTNIQVSRCLAAIRLDPRAVHIFHSHHILNSSRLRNGFDSIIKKKKMRIETL